MKIGYSKTVEIFGIGWQKIWVEDEIKDGETPEQALDNLHKFVEAGHKKYFPLPQNGSVKKPLLGNKLTDAENERQFNEIKAKIIEATTKEAAGEILVNSIWKLNPELKQLVMTKPSKNSKTKGVKLP